MAMNNMPEVGRTFYQVYQETLEKKGFLLARDWDELEPEEREAYQVTTERTINHVASAMMGRDN